MIPMKIVQDLRNYYRKNRTNLRRTYRKKTHLWTMDSEEENPSVSRFWSYIPNPDDPHEFGECMDDWHDYE